MVGGKRCEPVHGEVVVPYDEHRQVDGEDPQHDDEDRVSIMVKVPGGAGAFGIALHAISNDSFDHMKG